MDIDQGTCRQGDPIYGPSLVIRLTSVFRLALSAQGDRSDGRGGGGDVPLPETTFARYICGQPAGRVFLPYLRYLPVTLGKALRWLDALA